MLRPCCQVALDFQLRTQPLGNVDLEFTAVSESGDAAVALPGTVGSPSTPLVLPYTQSTWDQLSQLVVQVTTGQQDLITRPCHVTPQPSADSTFPNPTWLNAIDQGRILSCDTPGLLPSSLPLTGGHIQLYKGRPGCQRHDQRHLLS